MALTLRWIVPKHVRWASDRGPLTVLDRAAAPNRFMKCEICQTESDFEAGFVQERRSFRKGKRVLCLDCWSRRKKKSEGFWQLTIVAGGLLGYALLRQDPYSEVGEFLTSFFLIDLFLILAIVPHELGHAVMAHLMGWRVFQIVLGVGKPLFSSRLFGVFLDMHILPISGITRLAPKDHHFFRLKRLCILLAGPAVNAASVVVVLYLCAQWWEDFQFKSAPREVRYFVMANAALLATNLWPRKLNTLQLPNDGKQILQTLFPNKQDQEELFAARYLLEASVCRERNMDREGARQWCDRGLALYPENVSLLNLSGVLLLEQQEHEKSRAIFLQLLAQPNVPEKVRHLLLNNIAYVDALSNRPELLPEADAYSRQACAAMPWTPAFIGTRGTVLVAMGQYEEGLRLLKEAFDKAPNAAHKSENACHIAMAHARSGHPQEAAKYRDIARQLDPRCVLLPRVEAELERLPELAG